MIKNPLLILLFSLFSMLSVTGNNIKINCVSNDTTLYLNDTLPIGKEKFILTKLKCYLGNWKYAYSDSLKEVAKGFNLLSIEDSVSSINLNNHQPLQWISFGIGVDSLTTMQGVMDGDLDPSKGMVWSWQSGYINLKVEYTDLNQEEHVFHLGGFAKKQNSYRELTFKVPDGKTIEAIEFNLESFIQFVNKAGYKSVMSPGKKTIEIVNQYEQFFSLKFK